MNKQFNSQYVVKLQFTQEQIEEQQQFITDLENNTVDIVFEGNILEGKAYLDGLKQLVDNSIH